jgi:hypothetical protein
MIQTMNPKVCKPLHAYIEMIASNICYWIIGYFMFDVNHTYSKHVNNVVILSCINISRVYFAKAITMTSTSFHIFHGLYGVVNVFVTRVENVSYNEPFFISWFFETIKHFSIHFDTLDVTSSSIS